MMLEILETVLHILLLVGGFTMFILFIVKLIQIFGAK